MKDIKRTIRLGKLVFKIMPSLIWFIVYHTFSSLLYTLIPIGIVQLLLNNYNSNGKYIYVIIVCGIVTGVNIINSLLGFYVNMMQGRFYRRFRYKYSKILYEKLKTIDYEDYQSSEFLNQYTKALDNGVNTCWNTFWNIEEILRGVIVSCTIFSIIATINGWALLYALIAGIIYVFINKKVSKLWYKASEADKQNYRERGYIRRMYYLKDSSEDIRTTEISDLFLEINDTIGDRVIKNQDKYGSRWYILSTTGNIIIQSIYPFTIGVIAYVTLKSMNFDNFVSLTVAASTLCYTIWDLSYSIGNFQQVSVMGDDIFRILDRGSKIETSGSISANEFETIKFEDVSFAYDKSDEGHNVINNINMDIKKGQKIAIVGENGAGKTTFVKLLLRLYDVDHGCIKYNGDKYFDIYPNSIRNKMSCVFQNFQIFSVTVAENVLLRALESEADEKLVIEALQFSGLYEKVQTAKNGIFTMVTTEFDKEGLEFSGGERQKLAIARAYASSADIVILDEPSSALDPLAEAEIFKKMLELGNHKTLVFISHRLSTTITADTIYLFEKGRIVERGTHDELMKIQNGKYKYMFDIQALKYLEGSLNYEKE